MSDLKLFVSEKISRKEFFVKLLFAFSALVGGIISIPVIGALVAPILRNVPTAWRSVGNVNDFQIGKTVLVKFEDASPLPWSGTTAQTASWLRRESENEFIALTVYCSHLGCPVRWIADAEIFLCPCHGGVFNKDGSYAAGPPPHGLARYPVRIKNNQVEIQSRPIPITNLG